MICVVTAVSLAILLLASARALGHAAPVVSRCRPWLQPETCCLLHPAGVERERRVKQLYFYRSDPWAMTAIDLRTAIEREIKTMRSTSKLEQIFEYVYRVKHDQAEPDEKAEYSAREVAELEKRFQERVTGKVKGHGARESIRLIRAVGKALAKT